jgi:ADP-ribose pyrophosphatase YjhB (NUDIX family)
MPRDPVSTWFFVKVVVRQGDRFLLVQERRFNQPWHVPAGRAEPGETLVAAALRETLEETGVPVELDGILRVEHSPHPDKAYLGAIFLARHGGPAYPLSLLAAKGEGYGARGDSRRSENTEVSRKVKSAKSKMQNAKCKVQNNKWPHDLDLTLCIFHFSFCNLHSLLVPRASVVNRALWCYHGVVVLPVDEFVAG